MSVFGTVTQTVWNRISYSEYREYIQVVVDGAFPPSDAFRVVQQMSARKECKTITGTGHGVESTLPDIHITATGLDALSGDPGWRIESISVQNIGGGNCAIDATWALPAATYTMVTT